MSKVKTDVIHRWTFPITIELTHEQDELIRLIGNKQRGGHDEIPEEFIQQKIKDEFTEYLKKRLACTERL